MAKKLSTTIFLMALALAAPGTGALAQTSAPAPRDGAAAHGKDYWLSDGLNRLVFWKAPMQTGRSVAIKPAQP